jgi:hypothetical protein
VALENDRGRNPRLFQAALPHRASRTTWCRAMCALRLPALSGLVGRRHRACLTHRRTLNCRLKAQGTTFQGVLDRVRLEAARSCSRARDFRSTTSHRRWGTRA